jgi:hypothetical protein
MSLPSSSCRRLHLLTLSLAIVLSYAGSPARAQDQAADDATGWTELFNGKNLDGWVQRGGKAEYAVVDGVIVGTSKAGTPNSFLCTDRDYGDFILEYEMKADIELNSGVQIRSHEFDKATEVDLGDGKKMTIKASLVHGYQVEFDVNQAERVWTGGIYDESRRNWLYPGPLGGNADAFAEQGRKLIKRDDWNKLRVEARGPSIKTYLNGELRADLKDSVSLDGFIALQVHSVGEVEKPMHVSWKNLRIKVLEKN